LLAPFTCPLVALAVLQSPRAVVSLRDEVAPVNKQIAGSGDFTVTRGLLGVLAELLPRVVNLRHEVLDSFSCPRIGPSPRNLSLVALQDRSHFIVEFTPLGEELGQLRSVVFHWFAARVEPSPRREAIVLLRSNRFEHS